MSDEFLMARVERAVNADPRPADDWSDGDKLRLLAVVYDIQNAERGSSSTWLQDDLRRMADRLDIADLAVVS